MNNLKIYNFFKHSKKYHSYCTVILLLFFTLPTNAETLTWHYEVSLHEVNDPQNTLGGQITTDSVLTGTITYDVDDLQYRDTNINWGVSDFVGDSLLITSDDITIPSNTRYAIESVRRGGTTSSTYLQAIMKESRGQSEYMELWYTGTSLNKNAPPVNWHESSFPLSSMRFRYVDEPTNTQVFGTVTSITLAGLPNISRDDYITEYDVSVFSSLKHGDIVIMENYNQGYLVDNTNGTVSTTEYNDSPAHLWRALENHKGHGMSFKNLATQQYLTIDATGAFSAELNGEGKTQAFIEKNTLIDANRGRSFAKLKSASGHCTYANKQVDHFIEHNCYELRGWRFLVQQFAPGANNVTLNAGNGGSSLTTEEIPEQDTTLSAGNGNNLSTDTIALSGDSFNEDVMGTNSSAANQASPSASATTETRMAWLKLMTFI